MNQHRKLRLALLSILAAATLLPAGCVTSGTVLSYDTEGTTVTRAADQEILANAIDSAFAALDISEMQAALSASTTDLSAYVVVSSPFALSDATMAYIQGRATLTAGMLGIKIVEVNKTIERPYPERNIEVTTTDYQGAGARILMLVSYAGVDTRTHLQAHETHGTLDPDRWLIGRFKGTFAIVPRKEGFPAIVAELSGESKFPVARGKYVDGR